MLLFPRAFVYQTSHAKGEQDGEGGSIKSAVRAYVKGGKTQAGKNIQSARQVYDFIREHMLAPKARSGILRRMVFHIDVKNSL